MADKEKREGRLVLIMTVISRALGLFRTQLLGYFFGAGGVIDVINYSYAVPNQARKSLEEGSGNIFLIPQLSKDGKNKEALDFTVSIHLLMLILSLIFSVPIGIIIMSISPYTEAEVLLGIKMMPFFLIFLCFYSLSSSLMAFLQIHGKKVLSSALPLIQSVIVVCLIMLLSEKLEAFTYPVALLTAAAVFLVTSFIAVARLGYSFHLSLRFEKKLFHRFIWSMLYVAAQVAINFAYTLSSSFTHGGATYFANAYALILLPYGILLSVLSTVTYPDMALEKTEEGKERRFRKAIDWAILSAVVTSVLMSTFSREITITFFRTGLFTEDDCIRVSHQIDMGVWAVLFMLVSSYYQRIMILRGRGGVLKYILATQIIMSFALAFTFGSWRFAPSVIFSLTTMLGFLFYFVLDDRKGKMLLIKSGIRAFIATIPLFILFFLYKLPRMNMYDFFESKLLVVAICLAIGGAVFALCLPAIKKLYD